MSIKTLSHWFIVSEQRLYCPQPARNRRANGVTVIGRRDRGGPVSDCNLAEADSYKNTSAIETRMSFLSLIPTSQPESSFIIDKLSRLWFSDSWRRFPAYARLTRS